MRTITSSEESNPVRGCRLRNVAITFAVAAIVATGSANAQSSRGRVPRIKPGTNTSFGPLKQIDAGVLNVGYVEAGPADGPAVILLHGWPYDIHSFVDVTPLLASAGYRVIVPYCAATVRRAFFPARRSGMASNRQSPLTSSISWML